jgi:hypothetical protein
MLQSPLSPERVSRAVLEGLTFDAFVDYDAEFRQAYHANREAVTLSDAEGSALDCLTTAVNVIALVDRGCADVMATLPIMAAICERSPGLRLSILIRAGENAELADRYAGSDGSRIPTYVFVTDAATELGTIVERTSAVDLHVADFAATIHAESQGSDLAVLPEGIRATLMERVLRHRSSLRDVERADLVAEVLRLTENIDCSGTSVALPARPRDREST